MFIYLNINNINFLFEGDLEWQLTTILFVVNESNDNGSKTNDTRRMWVEGQSGRVCIWILQILEKRKVSQLGMGNMCFEKRKVLIERSKIWKKKIENL